MYNTPAKKLLALEAALVKRFENMGILKEPRRKYVAVRLTSDEYEKILRLAKKHAGGSLSAWVRYTALNFEKEKANGN